jgi:hypothetical protein
MITSYFRTGHGVRFSFSHVAAIVMNAMSVHIYLHSSVIASDLVTNGPTKIFIRSPTMAFLWFFCWFFFCWFFSPSPENRTVLAASSAAVCSVLSGFPVSVNGHIRTYTTDVLSDYLWLYTGHRFFVLFRARIGELLEQEYKNFATSTTT